MNLKEQIYQNEMAIKQFLTFIIEGKPWTYSDLQSFSITYDCLVERREHLSLALRVHYPLRSAS